jgi:hypothetical protein
MDLSTYLKAQTIFRSGTCWFIDPFEEQEIKVCFARIRYNSDSNDFDFQLIEDVV